MTKAPRFSVIVPVYNRAGTVLPTLQSVRDQTFEDFECIVVDDGSADGDQLKEVIDGLDDRRFRYVRRENGGGGAARNTGIDEAKGELIAFLDSDDRWLPEKLERGLAGSADGSVVFSPVLVERGGRVVGQRPKTYPHVAEPISEYLACRGGFTQTSTIVLPAALAKRVRFDERIAFGQDTDFALRLSAAGAEFRMVPETQVVMRDDETGDRLSRSMDWRAALAWLEDSKPRLTKRAYLAYRGSHVARMAANSGHYLIAVRFYFSALARGAFAPSLGAKTLGHILIKGSIYRRLFRPGTA
jgi:glycosyltransferase involved in cell wall biosynthesis